MAIIFCEYSISTKLYFSCFSKLEGTNLAWKVLTHKSVQCIKKADIILCLCFVLHGQ